MTEYFQFTPDFIVEATSVCDRACVGCYAPNVISRESAQALYLAQPELFLSPDLTEKVLQSFGDNTDSIAIRGGEPSKHPEISAIILACAKRAKFVYVETHGRWLLPEAIVANKELLSAIESTKAIVKISFDQMHGLSSDQLGKITDYLNWNGISYFVAITESDEESFRVTRARCGWIPNKKIIRQSKVFQGTELIRPRLGVLGVNGTITAGLSSKLRSSEVFREMVI